MSTLRVTWEQSRREYMFDGQDLLDQITGSVLSGDWDCYLRHTAMPLALVSPPNTVVLSTEDQLRLGFESAVKMYRDLRVTDVVRSLRDQHPIGAYMVALRFDTHVFAGSTRIFPPYPNEAIARLESGRWKIAMLACSLLNEEWPISVPKVQQDV